jgi:hypothetical protein
MKIQKIVLCMDSKIQYADTDPVSCDECGEIYFSQVLHIRRANRLVTGSTKDSYVPIPVFACLECKHVNTEFLPKEVLVP